MFTIKVINTNTGRPVESKKVAVIFSGLFRGAAKDQYTNRDGEAHFSEDNGEGIIYINGSKAFEGRIEGKKVLYI